MSIERVKAVIAYDGASFKGFQKQKNTKNTVTSSVESALVSLGINSPIRGSGRTDSGVHATGQVIDFEIPHFWGDLNRLKKILNKKLRHIAFKHISKVEKNFHARFSAKRRIYRYLFKTTKPSIFENRYVGYYPPFDEHLLMGGLNLFLGKHDFSNFCKTGTLTKTNIRTIHQTKYRKYGDYHIVYFEANGFLRSQVRLMMETLMLVASKKMKIDKLKRQLNLEDRYNDRLAPPNGLYLARVIY